MKTGFASTGVLLGASVVILLLFFIVIQAAYNIVEKTEPTPIPSASSVPLLPSPKPRSTATPILQSSTPLTVWTGCTTSSECAIAKGICGPASVNRMYVTEFEAYAMERGKVVDCAPTKKIPAGVACEKNVCILSPE